MSTFLAINWGNAITVTFFGFAVVFIVLVLLIFVLQLFGSIMSKSSKKPAAAAAQAVMLLLAMPVPMAAVAAEAKEESGDMTAEENAAIAMAIYQYCFGVHDEESLVLTFHEQEEHYHPWNSKIIGINKFNKQ